MSKKDNLTENLKIRVKQPEKESLEDTAKQEGISISELIRRCLFSQEPTSSIAARIQCNMIKHQYRNHILAMGLPQKYTNILLKELNNLD